MINAGNVYNDIFKLFKKFAFIVIQTSLWVEEVFNTFRECDQIALCAKAFTSLALYFCECLARNFRGAFSKKLYGFYLLISSLLFEILFQIYQVCQLR